MAERLAENTGVHPPPAARGTSSPSAAGRGGHDDLPLCVDMDGTLLRTDSLHESLVGALVADWSVALRMLGWLRTGKAVLKRELARRWAFDPADLPYNEDVVEYLKDERARGRRLVLCTAAHHGVAERVAEHLGLFHEVIATDGDRNLRGPAKAEALCRRFGRGGFVYAGNDRTDVPVWDAAAAAIVVHADPGLRQEAEQLYAVVRTFERGGGSARAALRATRPHQWIKNALCLVPLLAAADFDLGGENWLRTILLMVGFCLVASSIYVANDLLDLAADRRHPRKRKRPLASGALPIGHALVLTPALLLLGVLSAAASGALAFVAIYAAGSLAYSMRLKEQPLVDVFMLALLYTIRLFGGSVASGHGVSLWLLGFSSFLFLSLALVKRVSELGRHASTRPGRRVARRGYAAEDRAVLQTFGCAAAFASAVVLSLYVQSHVVSRAYANPEVLWGSVPMLLFWQCRLWLSTARGYMHDDPIVYAARDWVSWGVFACLAAVAVAARLPVGP